jgi:AcrR family transcriptional regulator
MEARTREDRRSQRTRRLLGDALTALMLEVPYDRITVQDIVERANVGRSTFYAPYEGKDSLLSANFEWLLDQLDQAWTAQSPPRLVFPVAQFFEHVRHHRVLYEALTRGRGLEFLFTRGHAVIAGNIERRLERWPAVLERPAIPLPLLSNFAAGAMLALLRWWLEKKLPYPPERMEAIFQSMMWSGVGPLLEGNPSEE